MKKASAMMLYILVKIVGLVIVAAILLTFLFPKKGYTDIMLQGKLMDAKGKPLSQKTLVFYSGITQGAYRKDEIISTDSAGRFSVAFQKQYTITMLKSYLKLKQTASPPFYFGLKLTNPTNNGRYFIVEVTPKTAILKDAAVNESKQTFDQKDVSKDISIKTQLYREHQGWSINAVIRDEEK
jgi:hypothetical protein